MTFFDLVDISERFMELVNPSTPEKMVKLGKFLRLREGSRVIDFGCGYAEALTLWAEHFGIAGIGVDIRDRACERARAKVSEKHLTERIEIVCSPGAEYPFQEGAFDAATCIDWDRYEADNWHGLIRWLEENPDHPERGEVVEHLQKSQDEYLRYGREYLGWAMYVLAPRG